MTRGAILVGVDTGGTFTDLVAVVAGGLRVLKIRSTPADPGAAVRTGLAMLGGTPRIHYGSTVGTNALLERRGARVALLTTEGFEDVIEIGRQTRPALYALEPRRPPPLVPRGLRIGVRERVLADGTVEVALSPREAARAAAAVRRRRPSAVAVCLLHSYARADHERRLGRALAASGLHVTLSHELLPEYREYERTATTVVNAFVGPVMSRHLDRLAAAVPAGVRVMQSNGGLVGVRAARAEPVRTILSGPAAGVIGAAARAQRAGLRRVLTLDMGGTSADVSVVDGGVAHRVETAIGGVPVRVPMIDIHTVGAGGGSLARLDRGGALRVGPESAGADPGPACYGRGVAPTVTDANLVLGRLVEDAFLGGTMRLDRARAERALAALARRLGGSIVDAALGVVRVANATMERALRVVTVERGLDPRQFTLFAFGGAGAVHAAELADGLGMRRVYVPPDPGLLSAWGVLSAEVVRDVSRTVRLVEPAAAALQGGYGALAREARARAREEGLRRVRIERLLDVRYAGQSYEVTVPYGPGWRRTFHRAHGRLYGHADPARVVEVVTLRLRVRGGAAPLPRERRARPSTRRPARLRRVIFADRPRRARVVDRDELSAGDRLPGPAVVCEHSATTLVPPGWELTVDRLGGILLTRR